MQNIENLHQGSKCFAQELADPKDVKQPRPGPLYYENRKKFYEDPVPHRHKYPRDKSAPDASGAKFSVWIDKQGQVSRSRFSALKQNVQERYLDYVTSRQVYCAFYEDLAMRTTEFKQLKTWLEQGYNLQLTGYDAYDFDEWSVSGIERAYLDPKRPFGHERVLAALLFLKPGQYPWRKHQSLELPV